ncbi:MAG: two-component system response regulator [Desulfopila sp.]
MIVSPPLPTVLVVDDTPENIDVLDGILRDDYTIKAATNGEKAIAIACGTNRPDIVLLDIMMPGMDGYEVCRRLKERADTSDIPIIFISAKGEVADESRGFAVGCVDYITKPVSPPLVKARVKAQLALHGQNRDLERKVRERTRELAHTQEVTILGMAILAEYRDNETGAHIMRTQYYVRLLAQYLMRTTKFRDVLDDQLIDLLFRSAALHDIGKVGVPDSILLKPDKLTPEEFAEIQKHTIYGGDALARAEQALRLNQSTSFLRYGKEIAYSHHERWDGTGYPYGLKGEDIPLGGRLMTIADIYDALISKRVYKKALTHDEAVRIITVGDGRVMPGHFDPYVLKVFQEHHEEFRQISLKYSDDIETLVRRIDT